MKELPRKELSGFKSPIRTQENTILADKLPDPARRIEIEIGDAKQPDFYPQFKTKHWNNEANFSIRLKEDDYEADDITVENGRVEWKKGIKTARLYELDGFEDGGFEFEVEFAEKPESNVVEYTIQSKDFDFFYQPPLTQEEIAEGAEQPDNVVGSYAVYHKNKANNRTGGKHYRTGKAFHIYRPFAEDATGKREWCDLHIDGEKLSVAVPQRFLEEAVYPVRVDPTIGYTSIGSGSVTLAANSTITGSNISNTTDATGGNVTEVSFYGNSTSSVTGNPSTAAVYSVTTLLSPQSSEINISLSGSPQWNVHPFTSGPTLSPSTSYRPSVFTQNTTGWVFYRDSGSSGNSVFQNLSFATYPTFPNPASFTNSSFRYSVYATYTAAPSEVEVDDERDAELTGSLDDASARAAEVAGAALAANTRPSEVHGVDAASTARPAEVIGSLAVSDERDAELTGAQDVADARPSELAGEATTNDARAAEVSGRDAKADSRSTELAGNANTDDSRSAEISGQSAIFSSRSAELSGDGGEGSVREAEIHGVDTTDDTRAAELTGSIAATDERDSQVHGRATITNTRAVEIHGETTASNSRPVELIGATATSAIRAAETTGAQDTADTRASELTGAQGANTERQADISGQAAVDSSRNAELTGAVTSTDARAAQMDGMDEAASTRSAEIEGTQGNSDERPAEVSGRVATSSTRSAVIHGAPIDPYCPKPSPYSDKAGVYTPKTSPYRDVPRAC